MGTTGGAITRRCEGSDSMVQRNTGADRGYFLPIREGASRRGLRGASMLEDVSEQTIKIQLPDGSVREVPRGTTAHDVAMSISPRLAAAVVVARIRPLTAVGDGVVGTEETSEAAMYGAAEGGERLVDLAAPLMEDVALELLKENDEGALKVGRPSGAHGMR